MPSRAIAVSSHPKYPSVSTVLLNRPESGNAMDDGALREIAAAFKELASRSDLRAVVIQGQGKHFCAGADIEWMRRAGKLSKAQGRKDARLLVEMCRSIDACPVPVIAVVHGACYGGGLGVVAACDIVLAAQDARMCFSECRLGILPAVISLFVLPKIGAAAARRYYVTAEVFGMEKARELGLVHEAAPYAELECRLEAMLASLLKNGPQAVRKAKALLRRLPSAPSFAAKEKLVLDALVSQRSSAEGQEGLSAFLEKRLPNWSKG